jgi:hypothetical protein
MDSVMGTDNRFRRHAPSALATLCLCAAINTATAGKCTESFTPAYANRDLQLVLLIEDHGKANIVAPARPTHAFLTVLQARIACCEGRVREAIALYGVAVGLVLSRATQVNSSMAEQRNAEGRLS